MADNTLSKPSKKVIAITFISALTGLITVGLTYLGLKKLDEDGE